MPDLRNWTGNIEEFADRAGELLEALGRPDEGKPTIRLIRDYIQRGLLGEVPRRGRDLVFGYDQLVRFTAARVLLADGWPRSKIREYFAVSSTAEIEALIPRLGAIGRKEIARGSKLRRQRTRNAAAASFRERAVSLSAVHADLFETLRRLDIFIDEPPRDEMTRFTIAPWCELFVDTSHLARLTLDEAQDLGRAVTDSLLVALMRKQGLDHHD